MNQNCDYLFKLFIIGNHSVGKSSFLLRFSDNIFSQNFLPSIGIDSKNRTLQIGDKTVKLQIYDSDGKRIVEGLLPTSTKYKKETGLEIQEEKKVLIYKQAHGVILAYDITNKQSFKDIQKWLAEIDKWGNKNIVKVLIGNKSDLQANRQVKTEEGKVLAQSLDIKFFETSAKNDVNVTLTFILLCNLIKSKIELKSNKPVEVTEKTVVKIETSQNQVKTGCFGCF